MNDECQESMMNDGCRKIVVICRSCRKTEVGSQKTGDACPLPVAGGDEGGGDGKKVPGFRFQVPGFRFQVPGSRFQV